MIYHVLNGDGLAGNFNLEGEIVICRECLIDGDLRAKNLDEFWQVRAEFIKKTYGADDYFKKVKNEFDKLNNLQPADEVNLWFGNEAFCQVNLWFILWLFWDTDATFYRIFPDSKGWDCSFEILNKCFEFRQKLTKAEIQQGKQLWKAFCFNDSDGLRFLSQTTSPNFKNLPEVCQVLIEKDSKSKQILHEITQTGETDFSKIFLQFKEKAGIYGYGDLQVKNLLNS
jgi:hypothetical protein